MTKNNVIQIEERLLRLSKGQSDMQQLEDIVGMDFSEEESRQIVRFCTQKGILETLHTLYGEFEKEKEVRIVQELLANTNIDWKTLYPLPQKYIPIVTEEIEKLGLTSDDHLAITGSGSFPATAISFAERTSAKITCIEKVPEYATFARKILDTIGYSNIDVITSDAQDMAYNNYNAVLITLLTSNKEKVIQRIKKTSRAKILVRSARGLINLIYPALDTQIIHAHKLRDITSYGYII